jgi:hypothetical protein
MFTQLMRVEPIPERVYALCCLVARSAMARDQLRQMLEPDWLEKQPSNFALTYEAARELDLVSEIDEKVRLNVEADVFQDFRHFRRFAAHQAFRDTNSLFFRYTAWYLNQNDRYFYYTNVDEMASKLGSEFESDKIDDIALRGWRFWASFLGEGVLHNLFLIPNMFVRIHDALLMDKEHSNPFPRSEKVPFGQFVSWLRVNCQEAVHHLKSHDLCLGLSSGLRMLNDRDMIHLENNPDSAENWNLYEMPTHRIPGYVTDITVNV